MVLGSLTLVGECMNEYWEQKKRMAPGCEPEAVTRLMTHLRAHTLGMSLAGAGGGGFLYVLFKDVKTLNAVQQLLNEVRIKSKS